ncbi:MAG: DUF4012 domain-containing protein [Chloroflexi bacterium]|nr:DUF4012 domain-containing protein [Chloroflexota bacterium]
MEQDLHAIRIDLTPLWVLGAPVSRNLRAAPALLEAAEDLMGAGAEVGTVMHGVQQGLAPAQGNAPARGDPLPQALRAVADNADLLAKAADRVEHAQTVLSTVQTEGLDPRAKKAVERLNRYLPLAAGSLRLGSRSPSLLGFEGVRHYLILAQNNDELRATGGFIAGVGLATLDSGKITSLEFHDSYAVDDFSKPQLLSPPSMKQTMGIELWVVRDANWFPDFPSAARTAAQIYETDQEVHLDGVVSVDMIALQSFVGAVGPLHLKGYSEEITGDNLIDLMRYYWGPLSMGFTLDQWEKMPWEEKARLWFPHRKDFVNKVTKNLLKGLTTSVSNGKLLKITRSVLRTLNDRHLLVYLFDEQAQHVFTNQKWDGAVLPFTGDYLQIVDTNVGYNKANGRIAETIEYRVRMNSDKDIRATLNLHYRHQAPPSEQKCTQKPRYDPTYEQMMGRCYWDFVRVYVPDGSKLLSMKGLQVDGITTTVESGKTVFAGTFVLRPGQEQTVEIQYALPPDILQKESRDTLYRLLWQKQSGTVGIPFRVQVRAEQGKTLHTTQAGSTVDDQGRVIFQGRLDQDRSLELVLTQARQEPK